MTGQTTRRNFLSAAATTAGVVSAIAAAGMPSVAQAGVPAQARLNGKLQVVQNSDFNNDYNAFVKQTIVDYTSTQRWDLDHSDVAGFIGGSNFYDKLQAQKAANQPVDLIIHRLSARLLNFFDLVRDATPVVTRAAQNYGPPPSGAQAGHRVNGKWMGAPFHDRTDGYWVRDDKFSEVGYGVASGAFETWQGALEACRAVSRPDQNFYGWGMTTNPSGDGNFLLWRVIHAWGGALADPTGEIVTLYSPETLDAINWLADVYMNPANRNIFPPGVNSWDDLGNNQAYLAGVIGFTSNAGTLFASARFSGNPVADVTQFVQWPLGPFGIRLQFSTPTYLYFPNGSRNFDAASQLADYLISDTVQRSVYGVASGYAVPAYDALWNEPMIANDPVAMAFKPVSQNDPPVPGNSYRGPSTEAAEAVDFQNVVTEMFGQILNGQRVEAAVRDAHLRCVGIYQQYGLKGR